MALALASRYSTQHLHLADEFRSAVGYELWRAAFRYRGNPDEFGPGLAALVANRACRRVLKLHWRREGRRVTGDVGTMDLTGRERDPMFLVCEVSVEWRGG